MTAPLPDTMRAIEISHPGGPEELAEVQRPTPSPAPGEVLIRVAAAGINRPDVLQRQGHYPPPPGASDIPGLEAAGEVVALGEGVTDWRLGDKVTALLTGGGYAQFATCPAVQCLPIPHGLDMVQAAALPETFFTVWSNLFDRAGLTAGETLLIHGGTSGIGTTAIQVAREMGVRVMVTAGTDDKCQACRDLGAELAVNYKTDDFVPAAQVFGNGDGVDVILDMVGGDYVPRNLQALAPEGRMVSIAFLNGQTAEIDLMQVMAKRLTLTGSTLRARDPAFKSAIASALRHNVWPLLEQGRIAPVIAATYPLERAADAHALMESGGHIGKIVLTI